MGVPSGVMKYNNKRLEGLGFLPNIVCTAVRSDILTLCMYYAKHNMAFFDDMSRYGMYHLGAPIDFFNIANTSLIPDTTGADGATNINYIDIDSKFVLANIGKDIELGEYHLTNALDSDSIKYACVNIQEALANNVGYIK